MRCLLSLVVLLLLSICSSVSCHNRWHYYQPPPLVVPGVDPFAVQLSQQALAQAQAQNQAIAQGNNINMQNAVQQSQALTQAQSQAQQMAQQQQASLTNQQQALASQVALGNQQLAAQQQAQISAQQQQAALLAAQAEAQQTELSQQVMVQQQNAAAAQFARQAKAAREAAQQLAQAQQQAEKFSQAQASEAAYQEAANRNAALMSMAGGSFTQQQATQQAQQRIGDAQAFQQQATANALNQNFAATRRFAGEAEIDDAIDSDFAEADLDSAEPTTPTTSAEAPRPSLFQRIRTRIKQPLHHYDPNAVEVKRYKGRYANSAQVQEAVTADLDEFAEFDTATATTTTTTAQRKSKPAKRSIKSRVPMPDPEEGDPYEELMAEIDDVSDADSTPIVGNFAPVLIQAASPNAPETPASNTESSKSSEPSPSHVHHNYLLIGLCGSFGIVIIAAAAIYAAKNYSNSRREKSELESARRAAQGSLPLPYGHALRV